jgi:hypothetical protein
MNSIRYALVEVAGTGRTHAIGRLKASGRVPIELVRMRRMHVAQQCFGLFGKGIEDAIYGSPAIRGFVGIDFNRESPARSRVTCFGQAGCASTKTSHTKPTLSDRTADFAVRLPQAS